MAQAGQRPVLPLRLQLLLDARGDVPGAKTGADSEVVPQAKAAAPAVPTTPDPKTLQASVAMIPNGVPEMRLKTPVQQPVSKTTGEAQAVATPAVPTPGVHAPLADPLASAGVEGGDIEKKASRHEQQQTQTQAVPLPVEIRPNVPVPPAASSADAQDKKAPAGAKQSAPPVSSGDVATPSEKPHKNVQPASIAVPNLPLPLAAPAPHSEVPQHGPAAPRTEIRQRGEAAPQDASQQPVDGQGNATGPVIQGARGAQAKTPAGELSFAMRLTPHEALPQTAKPAAAEAPLVTAAPSRTPGQPQTEAGQGGNSNRNHDQAQRDPNAPAQRTDNAPRADAPLAQPAPAAPVRGGEPVNPQVLHAGASVPVTAPAAASAPVKAAAPTAPSAPVVHVEVTAPRTTQSMSLQISTGSDTKVDVQLVERGGEIRVAVRTPDESLARTMREDLGSLNGKLSQSGFGTETWAPARTASTLFSDTRNPSQNSDGGAAQQQQQQQQEQQQQRQQQQQQQEGRRQRPAWLEEFDQSLAGSR